MIVCRIIDVSLGIPIRVLPCSAAAQLVPHASILLPCSLAVARVIAGDTTAKECVLMKVFRPIENLLRRHVSIQRVKTTLGERIGTARVGVHRSGTLHIRHLVHVIHTGIGTAILEHRTQIVLASG